MSENNNRQNAPRGHMGGGPMGGVARGGEKAKDFKGAFAKMAKMSSKYKGMVIVAIIFAIVGAICTIVGPSQIAKLTTIIQEGAFGGNMDISAVNRIGIVLASIYLAGFVFTYFNGRIMTIYSQRLSKDLREQMSLKINRMPLAYFDRRSVGDTLSRITNDVDLIGNNLQRTLGTLITSITTFFGSLIMMLLTNAIMTVVAVLASLIGFMLMGVIIKKSQRYFKSQQIELGAMNGHIEEIYSGHNIVKVYNGKEKEMAKFNEYNTKLQTSAWKSQFFSGIMMPMTGFIGNFGYVAVCVVGGAMAFSGMIEFSVIIAFMIYVRLFTQPLSQFAQAATSLQGAAASSERVFEFLEENEMENESHKEDYLEPKEVKGDVEFKNVQFGYLPEKIIINDFSAKIKAGQKVAIVGPTGAGKTTLVNLLMRFYELNSGDILIDGMSTKALTRENIHDIFCMVLQDTWLFEGTIADNVIYSKEGATIDDVKKACKAVGIDHFVRTLPKGYDTVLSDSANLSQGQKQLFTIARAMVENAPMLILDEATSSVDTRTEGVIQQAMDKLSEGRTSFVIAHRLSTIKNADVILVMKDGDILESGTHDELMGSNGVYAELYNSQFM